jgi:hypothetical protein
MGKGDQWWTINEHTSTDELQKELYHVVIDSALPTLESYFSDEQLQLLWLSGKGHWLSEATRLMYLAILLKKSGEDECLAATLKKLEEVTEGKPSASFAYVVKRYLIG